MSRPACPIVLMLLACTAAKGDDSLLSDLTLRIKATLAKPVARIRLPLIMRSSVSVTANRTDAKAAPFGAEFYVDEGRARLLRTGPSAVATRKDTSPTIAPAAPRASKEKAIVVSGVSADSAAVFIRNPRYLFELGISTASGGWLLSSIGKSGDSSIEHIETLLAQQGNEAQQPANRVFGMGGMLPVDRLFQSEGFKLLSATRATPDGPIVVKFQRLFGGTPDAPVVDCTYTFDPANDWLPSEWVEKMPFMKDVRTLSVKQKVTMSDGRYEADFSSTSSSELEKSAETRKGKHTVEAVDPLPESEFTLSAYGIAEPSEFALRTPPLYVWLLGVAGILVVLMVALRFLARRKATVT